MARAGKIADYLVNQWVAQMLGISTFIGLANGDPYATGNPSSLEPAQGTYARASITYAQSGRLLSNANALLWVGIPSGFNVAWLTAYDAAANGNLLYACPYTDGIYDSQGTLTIPIGGFATGFDG